MCVRYRAVAAWSVSGEMYEIAQSEAKGIGVLLHPPSDIAHNVAGRYDSSPFSASAISLRISSSFSFSNAAVRRRCAVSASI